MAGLVILTLLVLQDDLVAAGAIVLACGVVNALLVRATLAVDRFREQQREVLAWTIEQTERERDRVATEIRDGAAQQLAALMLMRQADGEALSREAASVIDTLCATAQTLQPPGIRLSGLDAALNWYVRALERRIGLAVQLTIEPSLRTVGPGVALGFFRIVEDILETAGNAGAQQARLTIQDAAPALVAMLSIEHLFTTAERFRISERAALLGGRVELTSGPVSTQFLITIPRPEGS